MWFHLAAAGRLLSRRRGPVVRMVLVAWIGTLWCVAGGVWTLATYRSVQEQASSIQADVVLRPTATESDVRTIVRALRLRQDVRTVDVLREQDVWMEFAGNVQIDDDLRSVVAMPRFIRFWSTSSGGTARTIQHLARSLEQRYPQQIEEVVWSRDLATMVDARRRDVLILGSVAGGLSLLFFLVAVAYSFRAELHAAAADLRVGSLLGARTLWIAMPHILVSIITGAIGMLLALAIVAAGTPMILMKLPWVATVRLQDVVVMVLGLAAAGLLSSWWQSVAAGRRALRRAPRRS